MSGASGVFLFLTYYPQVARGYSAVSTGLAFMPMLVTALTASLLSNIKLLPRTGPQPLIALGMLLAAGGMAWLTGIGQHTAYASTILGPLLLAGASSSD